MRPGDRRVVAVIAGALAAVAGTGVARVAAVTSRYSGFTLPGSNMVPSIPPGSRLRCDERVPDVLPRGAVVVFEPAVDSPWPPARLLSRVVGLPGEIVESVKDGGAVAVFGQPLDEPYADHANDPETFGPVAVPEDGYFVAGDNREDSVDSRHLGPIDRRWVTAVCPRFRDGRRIPGTP